MQVGIFKFYVLLFGLTIHVFIFGRIPLLTGVGITVVGIIGTNASYTVAYQVMFVLSLVGLASMLLLKVEPIDAEVR